MGVGAGAAAAIGAGISAAGSIGGSLISSGKAGQGAGQAQRNLQLVIPQAQSAFGPYMSTGTNALMDQSDLLGLNGQDAATAAMQKFQTSPGYQWSLDQGLRAVDAGAAARGFGRSGAALKAEQTFGTGLADQEFSNYFARLGNLSSGGLTAGNNLLATEEGNASTSAQLAQGAGNTQGSIYGNLSAGLGSTVNGLFNNADFRNWIGGSGGPSSLNATNPTISYGGTVYGTGGQSFPSFNPIQT